ncbi:DNA-3-methyladenine glycosylase I [bacterium]|nr:DNA-3-methyladenine glycosylase I [candidate division CSSED10-310 bacterium]
MIVRCDWALGSQMMIDYHDREWGVPLHDDLKLFEFLILDAFQAGLSWAITLNKRESMRRAFDGFNPELIAAYDDAKIETLRQDPGIIRNRLKIRAAIYNAEAFLRVRDEFGGFDPYIWRFVGGRPVRNGWRTMAEVPATSRESDAMSRDLKSRGFGFVGSTICYAFMQATGMVNDHLVNCFRYTEVSIAE